MRDGSDSLTDGVSNQLVRWRWPLFLLAVTLTAAGVWPSMQLRFDASIISLFPDEDPILQAYLDSVRVFGGGETVVVAYRDPELLTAEGLKRLHDIADRIRELKPAVPSVLSLADGPWPPEPLDDHPLHDQVESRGLTSDELREKLLGSELYRNLLLAKDSEEVERRRMPAEATTAILVNLRPKQSDEERVHVIETIRKVARENHLPTVVAGGPMLTYDASTYVDQDSFRLGWASTMVLSLVIGVLFRRLRWVVLPLAVVHMTLVWTKATLWLFSAKLSMVSTTLTALVTVVGVAAVVQVTARYREERERGEVRDALLRTMSLAGPAVFWASLTTAAGFSSLLITSIVPVQHFAMMLALASMLVFFTAAAIIPAVVLFGRRPSDPGAAPGERQIEHLLETTMHWSLRHPWLVGAAFLATLGVATAGMLRLHSETDFTRNFRRTAPIVSAYNFVERELGGAGTIEIEFDVPESAHPKRPGAGGETDPKRITPEFVNLLRDLEKKLREDQDHPALTKVLGLADVLDFSEGGSGARVGQLAAAMLGPQGKLDGTLAKVRDKQAEFVTTFWKEDAGRMRLLVRAREQEPSHVKDELLDWLRRTASEVLEADGLTANVRVTGVYTLLNHLVGGLMADQLNTFLLATALVFLVMCFALRSIRLAIVGLVPKLGPILMVLGAMGWMGLPIDMGTPMIAAVSMGLSVGFSIHYLYRFRQERLSGVPFDDALRATHRRVGGAMVFSNLALVVGFAVLSLSNFIPTVHFSLLANVALVGGLAGNLLVLPLLLRLVAR